jgi:hypothetical protein
MQIFIHIEVQLLLNDNNFCNVANHVYVGVWVLYEIKCCFPMNYHAWVHRKLAKYLLIVEFNSDYVLKMESRNIGQIIVFVYCTLNTFGYTDTI